MRTRRALLGAVVATVLGGGCVDTSVSQYSAPGLFVPSLEDGRLPATNTCDGGDHSPEIQVSNVSRATTSLALVVDALQDSPARPQSHWLLWNLPPNTAVIPAGIAQRRTVSPRVLRTDPALESPSVSRPIAQGTNVRGSVGYAGPCPAPGRPATVYRFRLYELSDYPSVEPGAPRRPVVQALAGLRRSSAQITATYER